MERNGKGSEKARVALRFIGSGDLRWFILVDGRHAGGITVHSTEGATFSYGIAVSPARRRQGIAAAALPLLFSEMRARGFTHIRVSVLKANEASLRLHDSLGFTKTHETEDAVTLERELL